MGTFEPFGLWERNVVAGKKRRGLAAARAEARLFTAHPSIRSYTVSPPPPPRILRSDWLHHRSVTNQIEAEEKIQGKKHQIWKPKSLKFDAEKMQILEKQSSPARPLGQQRIQGSRMCPVFQ